MEGITTPSDIDLLEEKGFQLDQVIGDGCYSKVWPSQVFKAIRFSRDKKRKIELACKIIDTATAPREYKNKFLPRELDILIRVNHPHIIPVMGIFQRRTKFFVFMRIGEKGDLHDFVIQNGRIPEKQSRLWTRQLVSALNYIHAMNIAHRDLKCENILITEHYNVKLTDFGFARSTVRRGSDVLSETYCGTLSYAAPEILKGVPYLPQLADMWSMGIIVFTMLNQSLPFKENNVRDLYEKQVQIKRQWRFRTCVVNDLSPECKEQVTKLMEPVAHARPTAEKVFSGAWIAMDPRVAKLTYFEECLLKKAIAAEKKNRHEEEDLERLSIPSAGAGTSCKKGLNILKSSDTIASHKDSQSQPSFPVFN